MKRFLVVMLSLGFIAAFAMPAAAVDFQLGGAWYMMGFYQDNPSLLDKNTQYAPQGSGGDPSWNNATGAPNGGNGVSAPNTNRTNNRGAASMYTMKLTLKPMVQIVEGLSFHMQIDALEGVMSDSTSGPGQANARTSVSTSSRPGTSNTGVLAQENIEFEQAFVKFKTALGQITAGYQYTVGDMFGTTFLQQPFTRTAISYTNSMGPFTVAAEVVKLREYRNRSFYGGASTTYNPAATNGVANDSDGDVYGLYGIFKMRPGEVGLGYEFWRDTFTKNNPAAATMALATGPGYTTIGPTPITANQGYVTTLSTINPYTKLRFGPVYIEAEGFWRFGNLKKYESVLPGQIQPSDVSLNAFGAYVNAQVDFKPFFVGAKFIYKSGDDMKNADKSTGSVAYLYADDYGSPVAGTLLLWNSDFADPMGFNYGNAVRYPQTRYIDNVWFYQAFVGVNPTAKLNITAKVAYAQADKKPKSAYGEVGATTDAFGNAIAGGIKEYVSDKIGTEVDLIAAYKIYDNLTYTVGAGYLFVGEYFKGFDSDAKTRDNYLLMHKLTLMF